MGDSAVPSAALEAHIAPPRKRQRLSGDDVSELVDRAEALDPSRCRFVEFFAGGGVLTSAVSAAGVPVRLPDDLASGGADFQSKEAVLTLRQELADLAASGVRLMVHFAPPCSTFARARDRSSKTRLRSKESPQGIPRLMARCRVANLIARNTLDLAEYLARLGAAVSVENPDSSYLWDYLDLDESLSPVDARFSACRFGAPFQKHTRVRCWNWLPASLADIRCVLSGDDFSCGRTRQAAHVVLEFGSRHTSTAAAYVPGLCRAWAADVRAHFETTPDRADAVEAVTLTSSGPVRRHGFRGDTEISAKDRRGEEDAQCTAGCRNPSALRPAWPDLWSTMALVRETLTRACAISPDLRGLVGCCGSSPSRSPPLEASLAAVRRELERVFVIPPGVFEQHNDSTSWRTELVGTVLHRSGDPDAAIWSWLREGAPMGLSQVIVPGGHFPQVPVSPTLTVGELDDRTPFGVNHPSFDMLHGAARSPAWDLLEEQVNQGYALLFRDHLEASAFLGGVCHPAPLGNVTKPKEDGPSNTV